MMSCTNPGFHAHSDDVMSHSDDVMPTSLSNAHSLSILLLFKSQLELYILYSLTLVLYYQLSPLDSEHSEQPDDALMHSCTHVHRNLYLYLCTCI